MQAAIQGKLTEQLPDDGDARNLLVDIQAEKAQLIKDGTINKVKTHPEITEEEIPFDVPENWCWVRLGDVLQINPRSKVEDEMPVSFIPMTLLEDGYSNKFSFEERLWKDVKSGFTHFANNDVVVAKITPCFQNRKSAVMTNLINGFGAGTTELHVLRPINNLVYSKYILCLVKTEYFIGDGVLSMTGTAGQQRVGKGYIQNLLCPLPPRSEQLRIVNRVEELLPEVQKLCADEEKLNDLQKSFPKKMKNSLLQSAIQGKLTDQLESDGDAHDLVAEIQEEKTRLIKEKKIKKEKDLPEITVDEIPFDIPNNWCWVRLGEVCQYIQRGRSPKYSPIEKYPVVAQKCNQWDGFHIEKAQFIQPESVTSYSEERLLRDEDLMWNSTGLGTLGRMAVYEDSKNPYGFAVADSHVTVVRTFKERVLPDYVFSYIIGPYIQSIVENISSGSTKQKELSTDTVTKLPIPLPPLAEQHRIIERLDQLLPLCDALE